METKKPAKILLIGTERNCRSIGYVLGFKHYDLINKLTVKNYAQYKDYKIYICEMKKKCKSLIQRKLLKEDLNLQYLDDICRMIDEDYVAKHKNNQSKIKLDETICCKNSVVNCSNVRQRLQNTPLRKRIKRGLKHPLRAAWHVVLRLIWRIKSQIKRMKRSLKLTNDKRTSAIKKYKYDSSIFLQYRNYLCSLSPAQLLLYVLNAPVNNRIKCNALDERNEVQIFYNGDVRGCCHCMVPLGNIIEDENIDESFSGYHARIVRMSTLNRSFCLCPLDHCSCGYYTKSNPLVNKNYDTIWDIPAIPKSINLSFVRSCNLACKSCRSERYVMNDLDRQVADIITTKLLKSGYLEQTSDLVLAGMGEVFYSPYYRKLMITEVKRKQISIYSNGLLFNKNNWKLVADKYETINVKISVDAATAETYKKIRGADFNVLMKNLKMLGELRRKNEIKSFRLCFVVQRDNFREMPLMVKIGHYLNVDEIYFQRMHNWGHLEQEEYLKQCLIVNNRYLDYDLWCVLQNPIMKSPIVNLVDFYACAKVSEKLYRKRYKEKSNI